MSVRMVRQELSLMIPVCHARVARGGMSRCADGRVGIGEVVEREWSRAECVGGADGAAARTPVVHNVDSGGFRVVDNEFWEGCHRDGHAFDRRHMWTDRLRSIRVAWRQCLITNTIWR